MSKALINITIAYIIQELTHLTLARLVWIEQHKPGRNIPRFRPLVLEPILGVVFSYIDIIPIFGSHA